MVYNSVTNVPQTTELYTFCDQTVRHVTSILKKKKTNKKNRIRIQNVTEGERYEMFHSRTE